MAAPAAVLLVKAGLTAVVDERARNVVLSVIAAILLPFLLILTVLLCALSGAADHNVSAVLETFHGAVPSAGMPAEYRAYIREMRESFTDLDGVLEEIREMAEGEVDGCWVKAVFYSLFFGADQPRMNREDYRKFADCFVRYEEREDEDGNLYTVAIPVTDLEMVCGELSTVLGWPVTAEDKANARGIYALAKYGRAQSGDVPEGGDLLPGEALGDGSFAALMEEASRYIGKPYVWGGSTPETGFDCSGYVCWVYTKSGVYHLPRTSAQGIFDQCAVVSREEAQPGDLIFFTGTYASASPVSHVGILVGKNRMLHCGDPVGFARIDTPYWTSHYYAMGRLPG